MALPTVVNNAGYRAEAKPVVLVSTDANGNPVASAGNSSGITAVASFVPTASAYGAGDIMDTAKELAFTFAQNGQAVPPGALIRILSAVTRIDVTAVPSGQTSYALQLYSATPPSAQADNDAWTLASADLAAYRGSIDLGTPVDLGNALYVKAPTVNIDIKLAAASSSLWARLVSAGGHTAAAVARQIVLYGIVL